MSHLCHLELLMVMLAATAGLRRSEAFGLQWEDVNFSEGSATSRPGYSSRMGRGTRACDSRLFRVTNLNEASDAPIGAI
jgi:integrase